MKGIDEVLDHVKNGVVFVEKEEVLDGGGSERKAFQNKTTKHLLY